MNSIFIRVLHTPSITSFVLWFPQQNLVKSINHEDADYVIFFRLLLLTSS